MYLFISQRMFLQTYHEKPILDGYPTRARLSSFKTINTLEEHLSANRVDEVKNFFGLLVLNI